MPVSTGLGQLEMDVVSARAVTAQVKNALTDREGSDFSTFQEDTLKRFCLVDSLQALEQVFLPEDADRLGEGYIEPIGIIACQAIMDECNRLTRGREGWLCQHILCGLDCPCDLCQVFGGGAAAAADDLGAGCQPGRRLGAHFGRRDGVGGAVLLVDVR